MAIDLGAIRVGVAANIQTVDPALQLISFFSDTIPDGVEGTIEIGPRPGQGETVTERQGPIFLYFMAAFAYIVAVDEENAQARMDAYLSVGGARSIWTALESDRTAGGTVDLLHVERQRSYDMIERGGVRLLMAGWDFRVKVRA